MDSFIIENGILQRYTGKKGVVEIPFGVEVILHDAFSDCYNLKSVAIPASVCEIEQGSFSWHRTLKSIHVEEGNPHYSSMDGILYSKDQTKLLRCPAGRIGEVIVPDSVKTVETEAFACCEGIRKVVLPDCLLEIKDRAFFHSGILSISIPANVTALSDGVFQNCRYLQRVQLPAGLKYIGSDAFSDCERLVDIQIPSTVRYIGESAFECCYALSMMILPPGLEEVADNAFSYCTHLSELFFPSSLKRIGRSALENCSSIRSVALPENLEYIGDYAFASCDSLTLLGILRVKELGAGVVDDTPMRVLYLPKSLMTIAPKSFMADRMERFLVSHHNPSFTDVRGILYTKDRSELIRVPGKTSQIVIVSAYVKHIWPHAFDNCTALEHIYVKAQNTTYSSIDGILYNHDGTELIKCPSGRKRDVSVAPSTLIIQERAFENCSEIKAIHIPESVTEIGDYAFRMCENLEKLTLPKGLIKQGKGILDLCEKLPHLSSLCCPDNETGGDNHD